MIQWQILYLQVELLVRITQSRGMEFMGSTGCLKLRYQELT